MAIGIRKKVILISVAILFLALAATTTVSSVFFMREYSAALKSRAFLVGSILKYQLEKLLKYDIPLHDLVGFDEQCQEIINNYGDISYALVMDLNGTILFHNNPRKSEGKINSTNILKLLEEEKENLSQYSEKTENHYNFMVPVLGADNTPVAAVVIGFPASLISHKVAQMAIYSVGVALIFLTLGGVSLVLLLRLWVTNPLSQLLRALMDIRAVGADSAGLVAIRAKDEFGDLGRAFNDMVLQLQESRAQLREYTQQLEFKVAESTAHLKEANKQLHQDIQVRREAERALRQTTQKLQTIFNASPLAIYVLDLEGKVLMWNPASERIFGWSEAEVLGKPLPIIFTDKLEEFQGLLRRAKDGEALQGMELTRQKKDGSPIEVSLYATPLYDDQGQVVSIMSLVADITERHRAQEEIRKAHHALESVFAGSVDAIGAVDQSGNFSKWNKAAEELFGYSLEELQKSHYTDLYADPGELNAMMMQLRQRGFLRNYEISMRKKDGAVFPCSLSIRVLRGLEGRVTGSIAVGRDLSEAKLAEAERQKISKMEAIGTLAGGIAHDFNNILTAIIGNISLAMLDVQVKGETRQCLAQAEKACMQAQSLSRQLLTFSKGGAPIKKTVAVKELLAESASFACRGSRVNYQISLPDDLWAVEADPGQISQVFQNLVINAVQAMPGGGMISIVGGNLTVTAGSELPLDPGNHIEISFQDQGQGIPPDHLSKIFDPYFTTKQRGSGLGLATSYSIIQNHHGHITIKSKPEAGSTFHVYLPASDRRVAPPPQDDGELSPGRGKGKVLVMDDEPMVGEVLERMLRTLGYEVQLVKDGARAIESFTRAQVTGSPFATVILDLTVPGGMGGKEAMERLKEIDPHLKAIVSSGYSDDPVMADFRKYGFFEVIAKPYRITDLDKVLKKLLPGKNMKSDQ
jgi:two-component system, cell cycle sensor histidine kinase and response regulator CckA